MTVSKNTLGMHKLLENPYRPTLPCCARRYHFNYLAQMCRHIQFGILGDTCKTNRNLLTMTKLGVGPTSDKWYTVLSKCRYQARVQENVIQRI